MKKQITMAKKLYTEEQVKQIVEKSRETGLTAEYLILTTPAKELPLPTISKTEKVQTALVWYAIEETNLTIDYTQGKISQLEYAIKRLDILEQAKQMEKEQHEMMFNCGRQYQLTGEGTFKQVHEELYGN